LRWFSQKIMKTLIFKSSWFIFYCFFLLVIHIMTQLIQSWKVLIALWLSLVLFYLSALEHCKRSNDTLQWQIQLLYSLTTWGSSKTRDKNGSTFNFKINDVLYFSGWCGPFASSLENSLCIKFYSTFFEFPLKIVQSITAKRGDPIDKEVSQKSYSAQWREPNLYTFEDSQTDETPSVVLSSTSSAALEVLVSTLQLQSQSPSGHWNLRRANQSFLLSKEGRL
jgi:hypothetical protein